MKYLLIMALQVFSHSPQTIEASAECSNIANVVFKIESRIVCVPSDVIFRGGFE